MTEKEQRAQLKKYSGDGAFMTLKAAITVYKKTFFFAPGVYGYRSITILRLPKGAVVYTGQDRDGKMRVNKARVIKTVSLSEIDGLSTGHEIKSEAHSHYCTGFKYRKGELVVPLCGFSMRNSTCGSGIHFFLSRKDARDY
jgi:hypothetical protein